MLSPYQPDDAALICPISGNTRREDVLCACIQALGLVLALGGVSALVTLAGVYGDALQVVGLCIYGASLILMYGASTIYHASTRLKHKQWYRLIDQVSIYVVIAGTYTPFTLSTLPRGWGWTLFGVIWGLGLLGVVLKLMHRTRYERLSLLLYLLMGWLIIIGIMPLWRSMEGAGFVWMLAAGGTYTAGVPFYLWRSLPCQHAIWQLFVLGGSISFYFVHLFFVLFAA